MSSAASRHVRLSHLNRSTRCVRLFSNVKTPLNVLFFCNSTVIKRNLKHTPYTLSDTEKRLNRIAKEKWEKKNRVQKMVDERREEWEGNVRSGLLSS